MIARLFGGRYSSRWTTWFLVTAIATSVTGFLFPFAGVTPAFLTGIVALAILRSSSWRAGIFRCAGHWRWIYAAGMVVSVYLLAFVGVVQAFLKVPFLNAFAPTQTELPFLIAQVGTLIAFVVLAVLAALKFKDVVEDMAAQPAR